MTLVRLAGARESAVPPSTKESRRAFVLTRDDAYREWAYTTMTRATDANRLYVIAQRVDDRDEFAPAEPPRDQRAAIIAALSRSQEQRLAVDLERDRGIGLG